MNVPHSKFIQYERRILVDNDSYVLFALAHNVHVRGFRK